MALVHWRILECPTRLFAHIRRRLEHLRIIYMSLFYNEFTTCNTAMDTAFEPIFWLVDHTACYMGPIMVTIVVILTTMVCMVFYVCILPHIYYQTDVIWSFFHLFFAHWLLINIIFNYTMAVFTKPGSPPQAVFEVVSICKNCIFPKPPRTHHCSVCKACVLKMDHHCPWINNCVGFYNHRYFFQFVFYMWFGTVYVSAAGYDVFKQHFFGSKDLIVPAFFFPINMAYHALSSDNQQGNSSLETKKGAENVKSEDEDFKATLEDQFLHNAIIFQFVLCAGVAVALGLLGVWHAKLISQGQTSIEQHINNKEKARLKKQNRKWRNPYDFGFVKNWRLFFGLGNGRSFIRHVLFPSRHDPLGNGIMWETATFRLEHNQVLDLL